MNLVLVWLMPIYCTIKDASIFLLDDQIDERVELLIGKHAKDPRFQEKIPDSWRRRKCICELFSYRDSRIDRFTDSRGKHMSCLRTSSQPVLSSFTVASLLHSTFFSLVLALPSLYRVLYTMSCHDDRSTLSGSCSIRRLREIPRLAKWRVRGAKLTRFMPAGALQS